VTIHQIVPEVRRQFKGAKAVYVVGDKDLVYGTIIQVVSELNEGKMDIKLVTKPEEFINKK
jgi:biopolymer transport protein ExbD